MTFRKLERILDHYGLAVGLENNLYKIYADTNYGVIAFVKANEDGPKAYRLYEKAHLSEEDYEHLEKCLENFALTPIGQRREICFDTSFMDFESYWQMLRAEVDNIQDSDPLAPIPKEQLANLSYWAEQLYNELFNANTKIQQYHSDTKDES